MPGVSGRELAKALGVSEGAVRKLKGGRLAGALLKDGTFDLDRAKALYADVNPAMRRERPASAPAAGVVSQNGDTGLPDAGAALPAGGASQEGKARAVLITEKALRERIRRRKDEGTSIDKPATETAVQTMARLFRDSALLMTDKYYTQIAAELGYEDTFRLYQVLDK